MLVKILTGSEALRRIVVPQTSSQVQLADFPTFCVLGAHWWACPVTILLPPLREKGLIVQILGQAVCNTSRHVGPSSVDWADYSHPNGLAYVSPVGALLASKASPSAALYFRNLRARG
jgi:hypothetical protein